jgi:hypothetical protein
MAGENTLIYHKQGGAELVVGSGGKITAAGTQAAAITAISEVSAAMSIAERQAFNAVLTALRGVGILAP